jgi:hypothetical protein
LPRLKKTDAEKSHDVIRAVIKYGMVLQDLNVSTLSSITGIGRTTLYDRLKTPSKATVGDVAIISKKLKLSEEMKQQLREAIIP